MEAIAATIERAATAEADLARERERHQDLRQVVKEYRAMHNYADILEHQDEYGDIVLCSTCRKADALLEPQPAPVATPEEK